MKFNELKYERPDVAKLKKDSEAMLKKLKKASTYKEAREIYLEGNKLTEDLGLMFVLCHIHKDMDTSNEFYLKEEKALQMSMVKLVGVQKKLNNYHNILRPYSVFPHIGMEFQSNIRSLFVQRPAPRRECTLHLPAHLGKFRSQAVRPFPPADPEKRLSYREIREPPQ